MQDKKGEDQEVLKTFDMYHFFSRKDVIAAIVFIVLLLAFLAYQAFFNVQAA